MAAEQRRKAVLFPGQKRILKQLGENIRLARKRRKLSQQVIRERTGLSRSTIQSIERGAPGVSIGHYLAVLTVLRLDEDLAVVARDDELGRRLQDAALLGRK